MITASPSNKKQKKKREGEDTCQKGNGFHKRDERMIPPNYRILKLWNEISAACAWILKLLLHLSEREASPTNNQETEEDGKIRAELHCLYASIHF